MDFVVQPDAIHIGVVTFCLLAGAAPGSDRLCTGVRGRRKDCSYQYGGHLMRNVGWSRCGTHRSVSSRGSYRLEGDWEPHSSSAFLIERRTGGNENGRG